MPLSLCPDCHEAEAPDQRPQAKDGRCTPCRKRLGQKHDPYTDDLMLPEWLA